MVGRSMAIKSMSGKSKPVVKTLALVSAWISPALNRVIKSSR
jgi:hypothetical protein